MRGTEQSLRDLARDGTTWAHVATVEKIAAHDAWGYLLDLVTRPGGQELQARLAAWGSGDHAGAWFPVEVGDEVLVVLPDGDPNRAVVVGQLPSRAARVPEGFGNDHAEVVHAGGLRVRTVDQAAVGAVVLEALLGDLQTALAEVQACLAGVGLPTTQLGTFVPKLATLYRSKALSAE